MKNVVTDSQPVRLRPAELSDLATLVTIENRCFSGDRISPRQMRYLLTQAKALTLVAIADGGETVVGYATCLLPRLPRPARLYSIAVVDAYRGKNIAALLIGCLLEDCRRRGYQRMRLEVRESQSRTIALYRRLGFGKIARLPNYYQDGDAALQMQIDLSENHKS